MKRDLRRIFSLLSLIGLGLALTLPIKAQKTAKTPKTDSAKVELFFKKSGINYLTGKDIWIVKAGKTDHIFAVGKGYLVGFAVLAEKDKIKFTTESLTAMLRFNGEVDSVNIRITEEGHVEIGLEATVRLLDQKEFNRLVNQLLGSTELANTRLQPYLIK